MPRSAATRTAPAGGPRQLRRQRLCRPGRQGRSRPQPAGLRARDGRRLEVRHPRRPHRCRRRQQRRRPSRRYHLHLRPPERRRRGPGEGRPRGRDRDAQRSGPGQCRQHRRHRPARDPGHARARPGRPDGRLGRRRSARPCASRPSATSIRPCPSTISATVRSRSACASAPGRARTWRCCENLRVPTASGAPVPLQRRGRHQARRRPFAGPPPGPQPHRLHHGRAERHAARRGLRSCTQLPAVKNLPAGVRPGRRQAIEEFIQEMITGFGIAFADRHPADVRGAGAAVQKLRLSDHHHGGAAAGHRRGLRGRCCWAAPASRSRR